MFSVVDVSDEKTVIGTMNLTVQVLEALDSVEKEMQVEGTYWVFYSCAWKTQHNDMCQVFRLESVWTLAPRSQHFIHA